MYGQEKTKKERKGQERRRSNTATSNDFDET
jgi:hypothetical protein